MHEPVPAPAPNARASARGSALRSTLKRFAHGTAPGRVAFRGYILARNYPLPALRRPVDALRWVFTDRELTNFTYEISNHAELHRFLARILDRAPADVERCARELGDDRDLARRLAARLATRRDRRPVPLYGRRVGWYCATRLLRPRLVVETGVADGLGSAVLLRALERNRAEGHPGGLVGFDIDPASGWLPDESQREGFELVIEDSKSALPRVLAGRAVDFFIHDSDHHYDHEMTEYRTVAAFLSPQAVIFSDNAHAVPALEHFSAATGRSFAFFRERPLRHFYPGAGIGASLPSAP